MIIVVGYSPTPPGQAALLAGIEQAQQRGGSLVVLNSSRGDALSDPGFAQPADLDWVRTTCTEAGVEFSIRQEVRGKEASEELIMLLNEVDADLCVIGLRRRTAVGKMLLGSNAHRILMDAPCHVLSVKPTDRHE
ncbi:MAG TPA: universal stress protein [Propionibacteriaceae bacterium]|nr:universal stress protein [Propionibacteriaceae bacterium]